MFCLLKITAGKNGNPLKIEKGDQLTSQPFIMERTVTWSSTNMKRKGLPRIPLSCLFLQLKLSSRFVNLCTYCGETLRLDCLCTAQERRETLVHPPQMASTLPAFTVYARGPRTSREPSRLGSKQLLAKGGERGREKGKSFGVGVRWLQRG